MEQEPPPAFVQAVAGLNALIATGPAPGRVVAAVGALVAEWAEEPDVNEAVMLARVEQLWDGFSTAAAELQEQLSDAEDGAGLTQGRRVLAATDAAAATLAAISAR